MPDVTRNPIRATETDIEVLARTVFGEARGETMQGQIAVAYTVVHRAQIALAFKNQHGKPHPLFGDGSLASACKMPWQYSCWNQNDPTRARMVTVTANDPAYQRALYVAHAVVCGQISDALPGSTHYYNPDVVAAPVWSAKARFMGSIGSHRFFKDVP